MQLTTYFFALIGLGLMIALPGIGSAIALARTGSAVLGAMHKKPETFGNLLVLAALPASQGLYGFVGFILYSTNLNADISMLQAMVFLDRVPCWARWPCSVPCIKRGFV